jgi:hypothetical protein
MRYQKETVGDRWTGGKGFVKRNEDVESPDGAQTRFLSSMWLTTDRLRATGGSKRLAKSLAVIL